MKYIQSLKHSIKFVFIQRYVSLNNKKDTSI